MVRPRYVYTIALTPSSRSTIRDNPALQCSIPAALPSAGALNSNCHRLSPAGHGAFCHLIGSACRFPSPPVIVAQGFAPLDCCRASSSPAGRSHYRRALFFIAQLLSVTTTTRRSVLSSSPTTCLARLLSFCVVTRRSVPQSPSTAFLTRLVAHSFTSHSTRRPLFYVAHTRVAHSFSSQIRSPSSVACASHGAHHYCIRPRLL